MNMGRKLFLTAPLIPPLTKMVSTTLCSILDFCLMILTIMYVMSVVVYVMSVVVYAMYAIYVMYVSAG